jgi:hypothetical protein
MKKLWILFLIMMLPLQSLLAEGLLFHVLEAGHSENHSLRHSQGSSREHNHAYSHNHVHAHIHADAEQHVHDNSDSAESEHHHHHCPGHCTVVLPSLLTNAQPELKYAEHSREPVLATSSPDARIERPNWG